MDIVPGSIVGAKFRLERPLSRGGMGSVWLARHVQLGSPVAVKFMDPSFAASPTFRARFEREARTAANLQSPYVVQVQDYGIEGDTPYLVMELLQGEDLGGRLRRCGRLPLNDAARIFVQAGRGLRRAHELGLVHRDLKPGNLFLVPVEDEEVVKILDFGIAKESNTHLGGDVTRTGEVIGSPHYMSPEQVRGDKALDHRSDLWSLGVILFRALTGALPFPGDVLGSVMAKILVDPIPRPTDIARDLHPALDGFFARALARDPAQRFQSVREMVDEFVRIAGTSPLASSNSGAHPHPMRPAFGSHPMLGPAAAMPNAPPTAPLPPPVATPWPQGARPSAGPHFAPAPAAQNLLAAPPATALPPLASPAAPSTLTGAGGAEVRATKARGARSRWALALGIVALLGLGATVTIGRFLGTSLGASETAAPAAAPVAAEEVGTGAPPTETAAPAPTDAAPIAPADDPAQKTAPEPGATATSTAAPVAPPPTAVATPQKPAPQKVRPAPPAPPSTAKPATTTTKSWGL